MSLMEDSAVTAYRVRPVKVLDGRDWVDSFTDPGARTEVELIIQPTTGQENQTGGRDATMAQYSVMDQDSPAGFWQDTDRLEWNGTQYQIEGHVQDWPEPLPHAAFLINVWEG